MNDFPIKKNSSGSRAQLSRKASVDMPGTRDQPADAQIHHLSKPEALPFQRPVWKAVKVSSQGTAGILFTHLNTKGPEIWALAPPPAPTPATPLFP